ncbi:hypothetical protein [Arthrobacter silvisoli]|uniref:hypothetical protein n=1 Tax=Arthrobacter silvisoli TaxID=2291022 RepID=UPI000E218A60|nr:hypothetical protein [Arthrobacter silvisoli]
MTATLTRAMVYRSRWHEARMIVDACAARIRFLRRRIDDPATDEHARALHGRRLEQYETELARGRRAESAAWAEVSAEELAAETARAAARYKGH